MFDKLLKSSIVFILIVSLLPIQVFGAIEDGNGNMFSPKAPDVVKTTGGDKETTGNMEINGSPQSSSDSSDDENVGAVNNANNRGRTMIGFFKDENELDVDNLSVDEMKVYGAFISNFYVPFQTKVSDLTADGGVSTIISQKFFGSESQVEKVKQVNKKIEDAIVGLYSGDSKSKTTLYKDKSKNKLSGNAFIKKVASSDTVVYNSNGVKYFDFNEDAYRASFKVLFGIAPNMLLSKNGMGSITEMYIDGFGNIWGNYSGTKSPLDYVLIMPASLNPMFFNGEFPVSNVFVTGALAKNPTELGNKPYYNSIDTGGNTVNIYGIHSPSEFIGKTDEIISKGSNTLTASTVKTFVNGTADNNNLSQVKLFISVNPSKLEESFTNIGTITKDNTEKMAIFNYYGRTQIMSVNKIADEMYYFDTGKGTTASDPSLGSWSDPKSMVKGYNMFNYSKDVGTFRFYDNSFTTSNLASILNKVYKGEIKDISGANNEVENYFSTNSKIPLKWLKDGKLTSKGDTEKLADVLLSAKSLRGEKPVYLILPYAESVKKLPTNNWFILKSKKPSATGLTDSDSALIQASLVSSGFVNKVTALADGGYLKPKKPFVYQTSNSWLSVESAEDSKTLYTLYNTLLTYNTFSANKAYIDALKGKDAGTSIDTPLVKYKLGTNIADDVNNFAGIYWSYLVGVLGVSMREDGTMEASGAYSNSLLPEMTIAVNGGSFDASNLFTSDTEGIGSDTKDENNDETVKSWIADLLNPTYSTYKSGLFKGIQDSIIIGAHRQITNSWGTSGYTVTSADGATGYNSNVTYINSPTIAELPFIPLLVENYMSMYMLILGLLLLIMVVLALIRLRSVKESMMAFLILGVLVLIPLYYVGGVSNTVNTVADKLYSDRFVYWAVIQQQQNQTSLLNASSIKDTESLIEANMNDSAVINSSSDGNTQAGVRIKWMSPKKDDVYDQLFNSSSQTKKMEEYSNMFKWMFASYFYQQEFVHGDPLATYTYRPLSAVGNEARTNYDAMLSSIGSLTKDTITNPIKSNKDKVVGLPDYRFNKILGVKSPYRDVRTPTELIGSRPYTSSTDNTPYHFWGLTSTPITEGFMTSEYNLDNVGFEFSDSPDENALLKITESPFYYFYNTLKYRYTSGSQDSSFKSALLRENIFKTPYIEGNSNMSGSIRDFLDLEGLFTYVVPYLQTSNDFVQGWTGRYGGTVDMYDFSTGLEGNEGKDTPVNDNIQDVKNDTEADVKSDKDKVSSNTKPHIFSNIMGSVAYADTNTSSNNSYSVQEQFQFEQTKKDSLRQIWKLYSPWVDQLQEQELADKVGFGIFGDSVYVSDLLNPSAYEDVGRPMIFSKSGMYAHKLNYSDLSSVESKLINVLEATYKDLMYLNNYRDYDDETLIVVGAMMATFNFNREFSDINIFSESNMLYPQGFELKNFNYDAYMRMLLVQSTGEPMVHDKDLYERVINKTSLLTGIFIIMKDVMGVLLIPIIRMAVLVLLFILTLLFTFSTVLMKPSQILKRAITTLGKPAILYLVYSCIFIYVTSIFLGDGENSYVGNKMTTVTLTDPTLSLGLSLLADSVYAFLLCKVILTLIQDVRMSTIDAKNAVFDLANDAVQKVSTIVSNGVPILGKGTGSGNGYGDSGESNTGSNTSSGGFGTNKTFSSKSGLNTGLLNNNTGKSNWVSNLMRRQPYMIGGRGYRLNKADKVMMKYYKNMNKEQNAEQNGGRSGIARNVVGSAFGAIPLFRGVKGLVKATRNFKNPTTIGRSTPDGVKETRSMRHNPKGRLSKLIGGTLGLPKRAYTSATSIYKSRFGANRTTDRLSFGTRVGKVLLRDKLSIGGLAKEGLQKTATSATSVLRRSRDGIVTGVKKTGSLSRLIKGKSHSGLVKTATNATTLMRRAKNGTVSTIKKTPSTMYNGSKHIGKGLTDLLLRTDFKGRNLNRVHDTTTRIGRTKYENGKKKEQRTEQVRNVIGITRDATTATLEGIKANISKRFKTNAETIKTTPTRRYTRATVAYKRKNKRKATKKSRRNNR